MPRCVAIGCNNNGRHHFPKDIKMKRLWEKAIRIRNFKASSNSRLCCDHFKETDYYDESISATGLPQMRRYLKKSVIPSIFSWTKTISVTPSARAREQRYLRRSSKRQLISSISQEEQETTISPLVEEVSVETQVPEFEIEIEISSVSTNIENGAQEPVQVTTASQTPHTFKLFSTEFMLADAKSVLFYTGLEDVNKFYLVLATLLPMAHYLTYRGSQVLNINVEDQFLLMLIKLRLNKEDYELSKIFGISSTEVGNIFVTWVNFVYELWSQINIWPARHLVDYYMPKLFKVHHPHTRVIIDATEIPITRPTNPTSQQATFSSYKHHNTIKFLVGATPGGLVSFCSDGYAGSTSDRQITERSLLPTLFNEKDAIMADRGFNVQDLFENKNIHVNTPTFLRGLTQLPGVNLKRDRNLSKNRIHIERLIGLTKTFKILKTDVNPFYVPLLSRIFFVCVMLSNFKEGIVNLY